MEKVKQWLIERPTSLLWVSGPIGCGKTTVVESEIRALTTDVAILRLAAFGPDNALADAGARRESERLTTKLLLQAAMDRRVVVIDGFDVLQETNEQDLGEITDCRFRQLLVATCKQQHPDTIIVVTSRFEPPGSLREDSLTVVNLPARTYVTLPSLPASNSLERRVLEFAALSRRAIDSILIQQMSGIEERVAGRVLSELTEARMVTRLNQTIYQVPDWIRSLILPDESRTKSIREVAIDGLRHDGSNPEQLLGLLVDNGNIDEAVRVYWDSIGNFTRLHREGRDHFGAELCRRLNNGLGPAQVSASLNASDGAWAVMNDWSQFAVSCGDAAVGVLAAMAAYRLLPEDRPRWDAAGLAAHVAEANLMNGNLPLAMEWCERSWQHAREALRKTQGIAVQEVMEAYDGSSNTIAKIYLRLDNSPELRRLIDDLSAIHENARQSIVEFNASSFIPLEGPSGDVTPEQLVDGRIAAMLALAERRFTDVRTLAAVDQETPASRELRTLLLSAELSDHRDEQADALLSSLRDSAEKRDDCDGECELAVLEQLRVNDPVERLALADVYLPRAEACGLGSHWRDLQLARSRALAETGHFDDARRAAELGLFGTAWMTGAYPASDWAVVRGAVGLLQSVGERVPDEVLGDMERSAPPERSSPTRSVKRRPPPTDEGGTASREARHTAALKVIENYENEGTPFALYFRNFDFEVMHGPFELGPKLTENALRDSLPPEIDMITVQDHSSITNVFKASRFRREAPALLLDNEHWAEVVEALIPMADLIVSEPLMLLKGVRLELQMIYDANRWDRTVLLLPPQHSFQLVDNDPLIQMFPRCVWADSLHQELFTESPVMTDLLERMRAIASLPIEIRRTLRDLSARDKAFPVNLVPVGEYLESQAELGSLFNQDNDTTRYYAFWQMFRAAAIRGVRYRQGDKSTLNRGKLAHSYLEMSQIMLDNTTEADKSILQGDPADAKLLVESAYGLIQDAGDDPWVRFLRARAEDRWEELAKLEQVIKDNPLRFEIRPRYGPLIKGK